MNDSELANTIDVGLVHLHGGSSGSSSVGAARAFGLFDTPVSHPSPRISQGMYTSMYRGSKERGKQRFRACESSRQVAATATTARPSSPVRALPLRHWGESACKA
jgi:hypothetical protein